MNDKSSREFFFEMMTYAQVQEALGLKPGTLYAMVARRQIPHVRLGRRLVRFRRADIERWIRERQVEVMPAAAAGGHGR